LGFADFHAYTVNWMKDTVRMVQKREAEAQAKVLVTDEPNPVVIT
jgi:hypothetical protein